MKHPLLSTRRFFNFEHQLLGLMLFSLLMAVFLGADNNIAYSFLLTHFGLFLLWQPLLKRDFSFNWIPQCTDPQIAP